MRAVVLGIFLVVLAQAQPPPQEDKKAERIRQALAWLENADIEVREMGRKDLIDLGAAAVPALEKKLEEKGVLEISRVLRQIDRPAPPSQPWIAEKDLQDLKADEQFLKELDKMPKDAPAKYVHVKYQEAMAHTRAKNYQRGFDLSNALLVLEPKAANAAAIKNLRRHCETMIMQTTLLEAKIIQPKFGYLPGEPVELTLRLRNLFKSAITLTYDKPQGQAQGGLTVGEIEITQTNLRNEGITFNKHQEIRHDHEIQIATGAQWEQKFVLDAAHDLPRNDEITAFTINAWSHPLKIEAEGSNVTRRIQFEPALVKLVPEKYKGFVENPLDSLGTTIDTGRPAQETFICSQLLFGDQKDMGVEVLIRSMEKTPNPAYRDSLSWMLLQMTGQRFGPDPKKWAEWRKSRNSKDVKEKKK